MSKYSRTKSEGSFESPMIWIYSVCLYPFKMMLCIIELIVEENTPDFWPNRQLGYSRNVFGDYYVQKCVDFRYDIHSSQKVEHFFLWAVKKVYPT